jgi:hypothetical protein
MQLSRWSDENPRAPDGSAYFSARVCCGTGGVNFSSGSWSTRGVGKCR